jgi:hypothetical protein
MAPHRLHGRQLVEFDQPAPSSQARRPPERARMLGHRVLPKVALQDALALQVPSHGRLVVLRRDAD